MKDIGLYIHIPFCRSKCPYCDFYSQKADEKLMENYTQAVIDRLHCYSQKINRRADTLYFGGGTPSILGGNRLANIIEVARACYYLDGGEITVECNPSNNLTELLPYLAKSGVNRISLGMQSAVDAERKALGRKANSQDIKKAVEVVREAGITNISLDLMLGVPFQTMESLKRSIDFCVSLGVPHISAYMLKIEEGTPFYRMKDKLVLPTEEEYCEMYLLTCEELGKAGLNQYEISNFAVEGYESRHNIKYWSCGEYLGIGAAAHSFIDGKRFYFEGDLQGFIDGMDVIPDGFGGDVEEYIMLSLRLAKGIEEIELFKRYGISIPIEMRKKAKQFALAGLVESDERGIRLTKQGFLISNSIIIEFVALL